MTRAIWPPDDSPCVGVCQLDENDVCIGCDRTLDEIIEAGKRAQDQLLGYKKI